MGSSENPASSPEEEKEATDGPTSELPTNGATLSHTELVFGLVGALGTNLRLVATRLQSVLVDVFGYDVSPITLSDLMGTLTWDRDLSPAHYDRRLEARMDAGRDLCRAWEAHDALALLGMLEISQIRERVNGNDSQRPLERHAYILRSLKRPAEAERLQAVYGDRFVLIGAYSPREERRKWLVNAMEESYGTRDESRWELDLDEDLIRRDEREVGEAGQNVRDTYHRADFFVEAREDRVTEQLDRCLRVLFGDPFATPTKDEAAMAQASAAARRSAEPGRQVGAAVANAKGDILAVGCNEVPRAFGGQYWPDDRDVRQDARRDGREFRRGFDTNNVQQREIASDVVDHLDTLLTDEARQDRNAVVDVLLDSRLGDITEFGRAVHAEMAAITSAARSTVSLQDAEIFSTTFPCHNCARHIIATGLRRLVYIEPYAKSQAALLHDDSVVIAPQQRPPDKVVFEPFVGIAPSRFMYLFHGVERKDDDGTIRIFAPTNASPHVRGAYARDPDLEVFACHTRETVVLHRFNGLLETSEPTVRS